MTAVRGEEVSAILEHIGFSPPMHYMEIRGGADSSVWKVESTFGTYALRILPENRLGQFLREQSVIELAVKSGVPIPVVRGVTSFNTWSVMWMDWAHGDRILGALTAAPHRAYELGAEFGRVQAAIHRFSLPPNVTDDGPNWMIPATDEESEFLERIRTENDCGAPVLLHMDYHPLNVLVNGGDVTAVLDWANACIGDSRFDVARTFSILELEVERIGPNLGVNQETMTDFRSGWLAGYEQAGGRTDSMDLFMAWAGIRMIRDLGDRCTQEDERRIRTWVAARV